MTDDDYSSDTTEEICTVPGAWMCAYGSGSSKECRICRTKLTGAPPKAKRESFLYSQPAGPISFHHRDD